MHQKAPKRQKLTVSTQRELSKLLGVSLDRVRQYVAQGMPGAPGAYCLDDARDWIASNINQQRQRTLPGTDADPLLSQGDSPALERYRDERAKLARLDRLEREGQLVRADKLQEFLGRMASILRGTGEVFQRQFGPDALSILNEAIDEIVSASAEFCSGDTDDLYRPDAGQGGLVCPPGESAEASDDS